MQWDVLGGGARDQVIGKPKAHRRGAEKAKVEGSGKAKPYRWLTLMT